MRSIGVILHLFGQSTRLARKRAFLTIAAITWGTVAIILLLSFGEGLKRQLSKNRRAMGERIAVMWPGETTKPWKGMPAGRSIKLRVDDVAYLRERAADHDGEDDLRAGRAQRSPDPGAASRGDAPDAAPRERGLRREVRLRPLRRARPRHLGHGEEQQDDREHVARHRALPRHHRRPDAP